MIKLLLLLTINLWADTILLDPVFKPPQFTTAGRPTCPSVFGCFGYNSTIKKFEWNDGVLWQAFGTGLLDEWVAGKDYKIGEIKNTGSDKNWLFKVAVDHTSVYVPTDFSAGKLLAISPPIITTGVVGGGAATLAGNVATVQSGTGFVAKYGTSPSPFPLITIVEWTTQPITLPSTGVHTLVISEAGVLSYVSGSPGTAPQDLQISIAVVDMNLGKIYDRKTYPTNPVGQLRSLAFFFGGMTKGLSYTPTGLQLARSSHQLYYWGADPSSPYSPNTKDAPALNPSTFYEFKQNGPVTPSTIKNTLRTDVYDNGGTITALGPNKWGFARIYSSLGVDDYVMYGQAIYQTEKEAKEAVVSSNFIKPVDLELTKFSAYVTFVSGDTNLADNGITVCEPFGCDKIGTGSGGGGGGDVLGPAISVLDNITTFGDTSGKTIKDSGIASSVIGTLQTASHSHSNKTVLDAIPSTMCPSGQILKSIGATFTCQVDVDTDTNSGGDVDGPVSSTDNAIARFDLATGKLIQNSGVLIDDSNNIYTPGTINSIGQIWSTAQADTDLIIDFNLGNNQSTTQSCGAITLQNMNDGGVYTLLVMGTTSAQCSFSLGSNVIHYPPGHGPTVATKQTLYSFVKHLNNIYVGWTPDL